MSCKSIYFGTLFCFLTVIHVVSVTAQSSEKKHIRYNLSTVKKEYSVYEPIWMEMEIENLGNVDIAVSKGKILHLEVISADGSKYRPWLLGSRYNNKLEPGASVVYIDNISYRYGKMLDSLGFDFALPAGIYNISYKTYESAKVLVESTQLTIEIKEPTGELAAAKALYEQGNRLKRKKEWKEAVQVFQQVADRYPDSFYAMKALSDNVTMYKYCVKDVDASLRSAKYILENYSNHHEEGRLVDNITRCYMKKNDMNGARTYLDSLSKKTSNVVLKSMLVDIILPDPNLQVK